MNESRTQDQYNHTAVIYTQNQHDETRYDPVIHEQSSAPYNNFVDICKALPPFSTLLITPRNTFSGESYSSSSNESSNDDVNQFNICDEVHHEYYRTETSSSSSVTSNDDKDQCNTFGVQSSSSDQASNVDEDSKKCQICGRVFMSSTHLGQHIHFIHEGEHRHESNIFAGEEWRCEPCGRDFRTAVHLEQHNFYANHEPYVPHIPDSEAFRCDVCGRVFKARRYMYQHYSAQHNVSRHHKCSKCDKRFLTEEMCNEHYETHSE